MNALWDPNQLQQLEQNYQLRQQQLAAQQQAQQQPTHPTGRGGMLSSFISELGGAGGAAGGAAIGTAIAPGIGTIIGAGLGGLLGGTGGRVAENEVRDNRVGLGDALKEGGLDSLFSVAGEAVPVLKTALKSKGALTGAAGDLFANAAQKTVPDNAPGFIQTLGKGLKASGLGMAQGAGREQIGAADSDRLVSVLKTLGVHMGSPEATQAALEPKLNQLGDALTNAYQKANVAVSPDEVLGLGKSILQSVATSGGLDKTANDYAMQQVLRLVDNSDDLGGLWSYTKDLEKNTINFARADSAAEPMKEAVAQIVKGNVRSFLNAKVPGLAELNGAYSDATSANTLLRSASRNSKGGVASRVLSLGPVKATETNIGRVLENVGKATSGTAAGAVTGPASQVTRQLTRQALPDISGMFAAPPQQTATIDPTTGLPVDPNAQQASLGSDQLGSMMGTSSTTQQPATDANGYSADDYMNAAMRAFQAGDTKSYTSLMGVANDLQSYQANAAANSGSAPVSATAQAQANKAGSAMQALNDLSGMLSSNGSLAARSAVPGQSLPVVGSLESNALGTSKYNAALNNVRLQVGFLLSGANVPTDEKASISQLLPQAGDPISTVQYKINLVSQMLAPYMQEGSTSGSSSDELAGLLSSAGY